MCTSCTTSPQAISGADCAGRPNVAHQIEPLRRSRPWSKRSDPRLRLGSLLFDRGRLLLEAPRPRREAKVPVLLQQARLTSKCHRWQAVRPAQRRVRLSEAAPIGPIIGHSDRAASEQKLSSHHTTSSQPLASIDATLHETPAIQKKLPTTRTRTWNFAAQSPMICGRSRDTWPRARRRK